MQNASVESVAAEWESQVGQWVAEAGIMNEDVEAHVRAAFSRVDRREFLEQQYRSRGLQDLDLPIEHGQWLLRPSVLIRFAGLINLKKRMRVLVAGAGSGYLCAVLNAAGAQVFGMESVGALAQATRKRLDTLGYHGVVIQRGDATKGWEDAGPFDAIVVTYPVTDDLGLPLAQLSINGVLVVPVACEEGSARITVWRRTLESFKRTVFERIDVR
jgi:protein-L-isoaspartate(D-aspartate) O-methyltransferase